GRGVRVSHDKVRSAERSHGGVAGALIFREGVARAVEGVFTGRWSGLEALNRAMKARHRLVVLYGSRGVGKTALVHEFCKDKNYICWCAPEASGAVQLESFLNRLEQGNDGSISAAFECACSQGNEWKAAFKVAFGESASSEFDAVMQLHNAHARKDGSSAKGKPVIVLDEFSRVARQDASTLEALRAAWESASSSDAMLILCDSDSGFVERELLAGGGALGGLVTDAIRLNLLPYWEVAEFFPHYSPEEKTLAYAIFGGMPRHLTQCDPEISLADNVIRNVLRKGSALYDEAECIAHREFREPARYNSILCAIAHGSTRVSEIARASSLSTAKASVYLKNLVSAGIVEREFPVNVGLQQGSICGGGRGRYRIFDRLLRFWYTFAFPNLSDLEMGDARGVWERRIAPSLWRFAAEPMRLMCADWLCRESSASRMPFVCSNVGAWWDSGTWIDVTGIDEAGTCMIVGAVELSSEPVGLKAYWNLVEKAAVLPAIEKHYVLFSHAGFDPRLVQFAKGDSFVRLVPLDGLYA
ncbi:hypothetical protein DMP06_04690, partial [Slackia equolifaciens]